MPYTEGGTGYRNTDTSLSAANSAEEKAPPLRLRVLELIERESYTADEISDLLGLPVLSVRPRVTELKTMGLIIDSGLRRKNKYGSNSIVWRLA